MHLRPAPRYSDAADEHPDRSPPTGVEPARRSTHRRCSRCGAALPRRRRTHRVPRARDVGRHDRVARRVGRTGDRGVHLDRSTRPEARDRAAPCNRVRPPAPSRTHRGAPPRRPTRDPATGARGRTKRQPVRTGARHDAASRPPRPCDSGRHVRRPRDRHDRRQVERPGRSRRQRRGPAILRHRRRRGRTVGRNGYRPRRGSHQARRATPRR